MSTTTSSILGALTGLGSNEPKKVEVSPEQESYRLNQAQDVLRELKTLLTEGDAPGIEIITNALKKAEALTLATASSPSTDPQVRKVIEDIHDLIFSAQQVGRNKHIADRLQKISEETALALKSIKAPGVTSATKEATENFMDFMTNWRPLFYMLTTSRDFRQLLLDSGSIARRIVYSFTEDFREESKQRFAEGEPTSEIVKGVKEVAQDKVNNNDVPQMTDEEWNRLQDDVQRVLILLSRQPTYREGISRIFSLLDSFQKTINQQPIQAAITPENVHIRRAAQETADLVASFSGRETLDKWMSHLRNLSLQIQKNENLQKYLQELKEFILKIRSEDEIRSGEFKSQSKELSYRGRELMRDLRDQEDLNRFLDVSSEMLNNIKNDEFMSILRQHAGVVQSDLSFLDSQGTLQLNTDMLSKLQTSFLPVLVDALKYIPVPKISSNDSEREFWLDNLVLCSYDIMPENLRFYFETASNISMRDLEVHSHTYLVIELNKLLTEIKDIEFFYRKKTFPGFEDHGKVTFRIGGQGAKLTFTFAIDQNPEDEVPKLRKGYANFDISDLSIDFDKTTLRHPTMVPLLTQMFKMQIRHEIERRVEENLTGFIEKLGDMMMRTLTEVNRPFLTGLELAKKAVKSSQVSQVYEKRRELLE